jgi:hypothetical protein
MTSMLPLRKILVLAANPQDTSPLRLDAEVKKIRESLKRSAQRAEFEVVAQGAVTTEDLRRALLEYEPQIASCPVIGRGIICDRIQM